MTQSSAELNAVHVYNAAHLAQIDYHEKLTEHETRECGYSLCTMQHRESIARRIYLLAHAAANYGDGTIRLTLDDYDVISTYMKHCPG